MMTEGDKAKVFRDQEGQQKQQEQAEPPACPNTVRSGKNPAPPARG